MDNKIKLNDLLQRMKQNWPEALSKETEAILGLIRLNDIVGNQANKSMAQFGLTQAAFEVLTTLRSLPKPRQLTPTELYNSILVTSGGMTKVLKQLEENNWIVRLPHSSDKRSMLVKLTGKGKTLIEQAMEAVVQGDRNIMKQTLSDQDISSLREILLLAIQKLE